MSDIIQSTTQQFLDIFDITNNFVIMKNGTVSTILTVDAMNFGLLAEEEQDAIMYAYAGLLNSLNYSVQIIINSRTKDVTSYLKVLQEQEVVAETETLRRRIRMYREFVGNLIHERNVLDKKFYVVIPAAAVEMGFLAPTSLLPGKTNSFDISSIERSVLIEKAQNLLDPKRDHLIAQFARIGLFSRQLSTQEIIQLFYVQYNPEAAEGQQIGESNSYTTPLVKASIQGNFMNPTQPTVPQTMPQAADNVMDSSQAASTPSAMEPAPIDQEHVQPLPEIHVDATPAETAVAVTTTDVSTEPVTSIEPTTTSALNDPEPVVTPEPIAPVPSETTPTPIAPAATPPGPKIPDEVETNSPTAVPSMPSEQSVSSPATLPAVAPAAQTPATTTPLEQDIQADLNATLQSLGSTSSPAGAGTQGAGDLPPLPEI